MARDFTQEIEDEEARRRLVWTPGLDRPTAPAPTVFVDAPGERERLADLARADRERSRKMSDTRADRWAIDMMGGSTTRRNAMKAAVLQDWNDRRHGLDPRSMEAQRIRGRIDLQGRTNEGLVDVAEARADADRAAAAAALKGERYKADRTLEGEKYKSDNLLEGEVERADAARDVADTNAAAARDVQASKNEGEREAARAAAAARAGSAADLAAGGFTLKDYAEIYSKISAGQLPDSFAYMTKDVQREMLGAARSAGGFDQWLAAMGVSRGPNGAVAPAPAPAQPSAGSAPAQPARRRYVPGGAK